MRLNQATFVVVALALLFSSAGAKNVFERFKEFADKHPGGKAAQVAPSGPPFAATITLGSLESGRAVNRMALGSNIQWVDNADDLMQAGSNQFVPQMLELAVALHPTVLRYPGGSNSDTYHWKSGMGALADRKEEEHFHTRRPQKVTFGTVEFLTLCGKLGAEPLITVNVATGTATEAADWVRAVNRTGLSGPDGKPLRRVRYWEIGNEPYLREDARRELAVEPEVYAKRANQFIRAMKAVDPSIVTGIPLRSDKIGAVPATPFQGFNDKVLAGVTEPFEFVALHNAYLPIIWDAKKSYGEEDVYRATMASYRVVEDDLEFTRSLLQKYRPGQPIKIAITEYNALYSIGGNRDDYIGTLASALYVGDLLRVLAGTDDLLMANFWSLNGNWFFGSFSNRSEPRPAYHVLAAYDRALHGRLVPSQVTSPTFATPIVGAVAAYSGLPLLTSLATIDGDVLRVVVINKDAGRAALLSLQGPTRAISSIQSTEIGGADRFRSKTPVAPKKSELAAKGFPLPLQVAPHSLVLLEIHLAR